MNNHIEKKDFNEVFRFRTKQLAIDIIRFCQKLPSTEEGRIFKRQLMRSSTSVAANFRAACRARSDKEFYHKLCIVIEEADESVFWIEMIEEVPLIGASETSKIKSDMLEIVKVMSKARKSLNSRRL